MDVERMRYDLANLGKQALKLSEELGDKGRKLNREEREIIRMLQMQHLKFALDETMFFYYSGNQADFQHSLEHIKQEYVE